MIRLGQSRKSSAEESAKDAPKEVSDVSEESVEAQASDTDKPEDDGPAGDALTETDTTEADATDADLTDADATDADATEADATEAEAKLIQAKAELAKAEAELARVRLAEAEAELARAEKAARSRQRAREKSLAKAVRVSTVELGPAQDATDATDAAEAAQEPSRRPMSRKKAITLVGVLGAVVVVLGGILAWLWTDSDSLDAKEQGGKSALIAATAAAQDISSYDYRSLDTDIKAVEGETTGQFRQQYDQEMALVKATATQKQIVTVGTILKAGIESVSDRQVVVVVFLNQQTSSGGQTTATPDQYRLQLTMTKKAGRWLVSTLKAL